MCSRYWSGDAVLQLAAVHFQSKVPWIPIQLPDELELISILQLHSKYEQEVPQSAVNKQGAVHGNATCLFASHGLSSNLLSQKCVCQHA